MRSFLKQTVAIERSCTKEGIVTLWLRRALAIMLLVHVVVPSLVSAEEVVRRDPFWPVGYEPLSPDEVEEVDEEEAEWQAAIEHMEWPSLPIRGRSRGRDGSHLVLIDGAGIVRSGDWVTLRSGEHWFHWRITNITAQSIHFIKLGITNEPDPGDAWRLAQERNPDNYEERQ